MEDHLLEMSKCAINRHADVGTFPHFHSTPRAEHHSSSDAQEYSFSTMLGRWFPNRQARPLAPQRLVRVSILLCLILPCSLGGCYWLKYEKLVHTHIELMCAMTDKMNRILEDNDTLAPVMMNEFLYPLERARDFSRIVAQRYADRPSLTAFNQLLDVYESLVTEADRLRIQPGSLDHFRSQTQAVRDQAARVETLLAAE